MVLGPPSCLAQKMSRAERAIFHNGDDSRENIVQNFTFKASKKPHRIHQNLTIGEGAVLSVEAGTTFSCAPGIEIRLEGTINVIGDGYAIFQGVGGRGVTWKGFWIQPEYSATVKDLGIMGAETGIRVDDLSRLPGIENCVFEQCKRGIELKRRDPAQQHVLRDVAFRNCGTGMIQNGGKTKFEHCSFDGCSSFGIHLAYAGQIELFYCLFKNGATAIQSENHDASVRAEYCNFGRHRDHLFVVKTAAAWDCRNCYWQYNSVAELAASIVDGRDRGQLGIVDFSSPSAQPIASAGFEAPTPN